MAGDDGCKHSGNANEINVASLQERTCVFVPSGPPAGMEQIKYTKRKTHLNQRLR